MARIRSIKPEFWDSEDTATLPMPAALTFSGLWNLADDEGRGRFQAPIIHSKLHGLRPDASLAKTKDALRWLIERKLIVLYEVAGFGTLFYIPSFKKHQHPNKPVPSKFPKPPKATSENSIPTTVGLPEDSLLGGEGRGDGEEMEGRGADSPPSGGSATGAHGGGGPGGDLQAVVRAYREADRTIPEEKCLAHVESAVRRGADPGALLQKVIENRHTMKIWTICDLLTDKRGEFKPSKTTCMNCGGTGTVANGVKDGAVVLGPCSRCSGGRGMTA